MSKYSIEKDTLDAIADAINAKTGGTDSINPTDMPDEISSIGSDVEIKDSDDVTVNGATVTVPAGQYTATVTKSVSTATQATPTISVSTGGLITASSTQNAGYVASGVKSATKQLTVQAAKTYTPGTSNQTIASGKYLTGTQTILGDGNLRSWNIAYGVEIFGVYGTYDNSCLIEGTPINMADGSEKLIEDLKTGDIVQSYDPVTSTLVPAVVIMAYITGHSRKFTAYNFQDGKHLTIYGMHGFYNQKTGMTKDIQQITRDDRVINLSGETIQWAGSREVYFAGAKKARYNLVTSNNLYFANGLLLGSRAYNKLQIMLDRNLPLPETIQSVWQQDCDDYNSYTGYLNNPEFYAEVKDSYQELAKARNIIRVNKKRLTDSDYKVQKFAEGLIEEQEWKTAKGKRAKYRTQINDSETTATECRAKIDDVIAKYRGKDVTPRSIFEACCTRDNAIFDKVKAYFSESEVNNVE